jgi:hypothetical protein
MWDVTYVACALGASAVALGACDAALWVCGVRAAARWPALHAAGNAAVCVLALPGVVATVVDPLHSMDARVYPPTHAAASPWALCVVLALHAYHVAFFTLTRADRFHHVLFMPTFGVCGFGFEWGALRQFLAFFICGLPGMLDYAAICLAHAGAIDVQTRRAVTARLSVWLRAPALLFEATLHCVALAHGTTTVPRPVAALVAALVAFNGMFYAASSVRSEVAHRT